MKKLKEMLNDKGYKKHSKVNPLILQSDAIGVFRDYLLALKDEVPSDDVGTIELVIWRIENEE